jgi:hypothetical protein
MLFDPRFDLGVLFHPVLDCIGMHLSSIRFPSLGPHGVHKKNQKARNSFEKRAFLNLASPRGFEPGGGLLMCWTTVTRRS